MCDETVIVDPKDGMYPHRYVDVAADGSSAETVDLFDADLREEPAGVETPFDPCGSKTLRLRGWMGAASADAASVPDCTFVVTLVGVNRPVAGEVAQPKGRTLLVLTFTAGTSTNTGKNPITGATASGLVFKEVDTISVTEAYTRYSILDGTSDATGGKNKEAVLEFDPCGMIVKAYITEILEAFELLTTPKIAIALER